ncbi:MAG: DUF2550 domain-containing protein [Ruaniaceae bacterium]|nr:DUF2550 domain-containing protein [Ruaniaceae bacterium]
MGWLWAVPLVLLAALITWYFARLRFVSNRVGSFECSVLRKGRWAEGYACYAVGRLDWHPILSIASHPAISWKRDTSDVRSVTYADSGHRASVVLSSGGQEHTLSMPSQAYSGLRSWLESSPPSPSSYR